MWYASPRSVSQNQLQGQPLVLRWRGTKQNVFYIMGRIRTKHYVNAHVPTHQQWLLNGYLTLKKVYWWNHSVPFYSLSSYSTVSIISEKSFGVFQKVTCCFELCALMKWDFGGSLKLTPLLIGLAAPQDLLKWIKGLEMFWHPRAEMAVHSITPRRLDFPGSWTTTSLKLPPVFGNSDQEIRGTSTTLSSELDMAALFSIIETKLPNTLFTSHLVCFCTMKKLHDSHVQHLRLYACCHVQTIMHCAAISGHWLTMLTQQWTRPSGFSDSTGMYQLECGVIRNFGLQLPREIEHALSVGVIAL